MLLCLWSGVFKTILGKLVLTLFLANYMYWLVYHN